MSTKEEKSSSSTESILEWEKVSCTGIVPEGRSGASLTILGNTGYLFGGLSKSNAKRGPNNDMYMAKIRNEKLEWSVPKIEGSRPSGRWDHTSTLIGDNFILVFGGSVSRTLRTNETWIFDTVVQKWTHLKHLDINAPSPRSGHTCTLVDENMLYCFGGFGGEGYSRREMNDMYVLDCTDLEKLKWRRVNAKGTPPEARSGHASCAVRDRDIIVCGGWNSHTKFRDIHIFNTKTCAWTRCRRDMNVRITLTYLLTHSLIHSLNQPINQLRYQDGDTPSPV